VRAAALGGLALALVACAHGDPPPPAAPKPPTACDRAADSMVGAMVAHLPPADVPTEQADALRRLIRVRCERDGWSAEVTGCLIAIQKIADAEPCAKIMPADQQAALARDLEAQSGARAAARPAAEPAHRPAGAADAPPGGGP
jgi:hypothetical protein